MRIYPPHASVYFRIASAHPKADKTAMTDDPNEALRERIQQAMVALETDATGLARVLGRGKDYVRDFLDGRKRTIDAISLQIIERAVREKNGNRLIEAHPERRSPMEPGASDDLRVYAAAEGGPGEMIVSTDPVEVVTRPWFMKEVRDGFAILVVGESMEPVYEPGDMAIINPRLAPMKGKDAVFTSGEYGDAPGSDYRATIKRLVRSDTKCWYVRQFNEPREFALEKREWPRALRVVGKLSGG